MELIRIEGKETVFKYDLENDDFRFFMELHKISKRSRFNPHTIRAANVHFYNLVKPYLETLDLEIEGFLPYEPDINTNSNSTTISFKDKKIIPGRESVLDGYKPEIEFVIGASNIQEGLIYAKGLLRRVGTYQLQILEDIALQAAKGNSGMDAPQITRTNNGLYVTSTSQMFRALDSLEKISNTLNEATFKRLSDLKNGIQRLKTYDKESIAIQDLIDNYQELIETLAPPTF